MLTPDVRFEGWTTETWTRFLHLWKPRASPDREPTRPRGCVIAIHEGGRLRKLLHTSRGRLDPQQAWPVPLEELAEIHSASWALSAHAGALEDMMERFGARLSRKDDLTAQALLVVTIVREMLQEGAIERWPKRLQGLPVPTEIMVRRAIDSVCPDGHAMALGLFREGELWTAAVARRRGSGFDVLAGPEDVRLRMGLLSGDWRRDYRHLARAVEEQYAPLAMGCFSEVDRFRALQVDTSPGAWGRASVVRDIVLSPTPIGIRLAIGADGARYAFETFRTLSRRALAAPALAPINSLVGHADAILEPVVTRARRRIGTAAGDKDVSSTLGFDPLAALRALLRR